jgi:hypothetical protein
MPDALTWFAIANSTNAEHVAEDAREAAERAEAMARVRGFVHDDSTVQQQQEYAESIRVLHPVEQHCEPMSRPARVTLGICIILWIIAVTGAGVYGWKNPPPWSDRAGHAFDCAGMVAVGIPLACFLAFAFGFLMCVPFYLIFGS